MLLPPYTAYPSGKVFCTKNKQKRVIAHFFDKDQMKHAIALLNGGGDACPAELRVALAEWLRLLDDGKPFKSARTLVEQLARKWLGMSVPAPEPATN